jgi:hypothetical protein
MNRGRETREASSAAPALPAKHGLPLRVIQPAVKNRESVPPGPIDTRTFLPHFGQRPS